MLHIINKSPFEKNSFASAVRHAGNNSVFLLIEDGVYAALASGTVNDTLQKAMGVGKVVALGNDINTRGIKEKIADGVEITDYAGFVDLVAGSERVHSWL